jgi:RNA polymerase sigma-70 factor (ECF subfamily)
MAQNNDDLKFAFEKYLPALILFARQWTASHQDAEDVVQEAFLRFWRRNGALDETSLARLYVIVRSAAIDLFRKNRRRARRETESAALAAVLDSSFETVTRAEETFAIDVELALQSLVPEQREVLVLKIWSRFTFAQIAEVTSLPLGTVTSRYRYALAMLRRKLTSTVYDQPTT